MNEVVVSTSHSLREYESSPQLGSAVQYGIVATAAAALLNLLRKFTLFGYESLRRNLVLLCCIVDCGFDITSASQMLVFTATWFCCSIWDCGYGRSCAA